MVFSKDLLVDLYLSTSDKKNKEKCFKELYAGLKNGAMKFCHFYSNTLFPRYRQDFFEEAEQEAQICLLRCMDFYTKQKGTKFTTFYYTCLKNELSTMRDRYVHVSRNETTDTNLVEWNGEDKTILLDAEDLADNAILRDIFENAIKKIDFKKPVHKNIFSDYIGFSGNDTTYHFAYLGEKYLLSRTAIKKICDKYFDELKDILAKENKLEIIAQFL